MTVKLVNFIFLPYPIDSLTMLPVIKSRKLHDGRSLGNHLSGSSPYSYNKEKLSYEERRNKLEQNSDGINENRTFDFQSSAYFTAYNNFSPHGYNIKPFSTPRSETGLSLYS